MQPIWISSHYKDYCHKLTNITLQQQIDSYGEVEFVPFVRGGVGISPPSLD